PTVASGRGSGKPLQRRSGSFPEEDVGTGTSSTDVPVPGLDGYGVVVVVVSSTGQFGFDGRSTAARRTARASSAVILPSPLKSQTVRLHSFRPTAACSTPRASLAVSSQSVSMKLPQTGQTGSSVVVVAPQSGLTTPVQTPLVQTSPVVHWSASLHGSVLLTFSHASVPSSHESVVQALVSAQSRAVPRQAPFAQVSPTVQKNVSSHAIVLLTLSQVSVPSLQESVVQTLLSPQSLAGPAAHAPPLQVSPVVQNSPSSHGSVLFTLLQ